MGRKLLTSVGVLGLLVTLGSLIAVYQFRGLIATAYRGYPGEEVFVDIDTGDSIQVIAERLVAVGVVPDSWTFRIAVWQSGRERDLQAGEYRFSGSMSPLKVVEKIATGKVVLRTLTFPEGLTIRGMADIFDGSGFGAHDQFMAQAARGELIHDLDPLATDLEGYLFPETYSLPRNATALDLVELMVAQFRLTFDSALRAEALHQERTIRETVILGSLIQQETGSDAEHALVSAVYNNRLRIGMGLQCDPTIIYALQRDGLYDGNLTRADLQYDSPYNTYRYPGLPPGPIASPGRAAFEAALYPADVSFLYFVSRNDGTHEFANTLQEHNRNVQRYQVEHSRVRRGVGRARR